MYGKEKQKNQGKRLKSKKNERAHRKNSASALNGFPRLKKNGMNK